MPQSFDIEIPRQAGPLADSIIIGKPFDVDRAPNAFNIARKNRLIIDWPKALKEAKIDLSLQPGPHFKRFFEDAWGSNGSPDDIMRSKNIIELIEAWPGFIHDPESVRHLVNVPIDRPLFVKGWRRFRVVPFADGEPIPLTTGCVLRLPGRHGPDRWYMPLARQESGHDRPVATEHFDDWNDGWEDIVAIIQVFHPGPKPADDAASLAAQGVAKEEAKTCFPVSELVRADAAVIEQQYKRLMDETLLVNAYQANAVNIATQIQTAPVTAIPELTRRYRELSSFGTDLKIRKRQLADAASDLGYTLFTSDQQFETYNEKGQPVPLNVEEGELYNKSHRSVSWVTYQTMSGSHRGLFRRSSWSYQIPTQHSKSFDYFEKSDADTDPWVEVFDFYKGHGFNIFMFFEGPDGLMSADGASPAQVMQRCSEDEGYRRKCVVGFPERETAITGESFLIGYNIVVRPAPDLFVREFPEISIAEDLTYRFTWTGTVLGELAATIPLAPGEEREVSVSLTRKYETTRTETASSLVDVARLDRSDFETFFEKELRTEKSTATSFAAEAKGSYGAASGSANFSRTASTSEVARQLNRAVQKAAQEVNRKSREERSLTVTEKTEITSSNSTSLKVRNINEGCTSNIQFFRLLNAYKSRLTLEGFSYAAKAGSSPLSSEDIRQEINFGSRDFDDLFDWVTHQSRFPVDLSAQSAKKLKALNSLIREQIVSCLMSYHIEDGDAHLSANNASRKATELVATWNGSLDDGDLDSLHTGVSGAQDEIAATLAQTVFEETNFAYDSGGLYADVVLGSNQATEAYADEMRRLELAKHRAEVALIDARAEWLTSRARTTSKHGAARRLLDTFRGRGPDLTNETATKVEP